MKYFMIYLISFQLSAYTRTYCICPERGGHAAAKVRTTVNSYCTEHVKSDEANEYMINIYIYIYKLL
jgi:hypothetical protein